MNNSLVDMHRNDDEDMQGTVCECKDVSVDEKPAVGRLPELESTESAFDLRLLPRSTEAEVWGAAIRQLPPSSLTVRC